MFLTLMYEIEPQSFAGLKQHQHDHKYHVYSNQHQYHQETKHTHYLLNGETKVHV